MRELFRNINYYLWRPSVGDPAWITTLIVLMYWSTALLCLAYAWHLWRGAPQPRAANQRGNPHLLVGSQAALILCLGLGKQVHLGSRVTSVGRAWAAAQGWYSFRQPVQEDLITGILVSGALLLVAASWYWRHTLRHHWHLLLGVMGLLTYNAIRMVSLHDVDSLLYSRVLGVRWDWIFELSALFFIGGALVLAFPWHQQEKIAESVRSRDR